MKVLNELNPILGLELTATPQIEIGKKLPQSFKNIVYQYSLAKAITDGYVKNPTVATKVNFNAKDYSDTDLDKLKIRDGLYIHELTKVELEIYSVNSRQKHVKPFMLIVCKDTQHAGEIKSYIQSDKCYNGKYKNKVIELHSNQKGLEKDENISKLISLESEENEIEVVIHVNMLKEGWDVSNLYTIVPLRVANSTTLIEQTIGRGLRLPYGKRTGIETIDRLTVIVHERFEQLINAANEESSIIKRENIIDIDSLIEPNKTKVSIITKTKFDEYIDTVAETKENTTSELEKMQLTAELQLAYNVEKVAEEIINTNENINTLSDLNNDNIKEEVIRITKENIDKKQVSFINIEKFEELINEIYLKYIQQNRIDIPEIELVPINEITYEFLDFDLYTLNLHYTKLSNEMIVQNLSTHEITKISMEGNNTLNDTPQKTILKEILKHSEIDYTMCSNLLYKLINQAINYFKSYMKDEDIENMIFFKKKDIAEEIYKQIMQHFKTKEQQFEVRLKRKISPILKQGYTKYKEDKILNCNTPIDGSMLSSGFNGYLKSYFNINFFDSVPEQIFAIILEISDEVTKWLRPAFRQFNIRWNGSHLYEPDFICETNDYIYMVEIKAQNQLFNPEVIAKKKSALEYCKNVNNLNIKGQKKWKYVIINSENISRNKTFLSLIENEFNQDYNN